MWCGGWDELEREGGWVGRRLKNVIMKEGKPVFPFVLQPEE